MSHHQLAYNKIFKFIDESETPFDFQCSSVMIDLFSQMFNEYSSMKKNLIDLLNDVYNRKNPQPKEEKKIA